MKRALNRCGMSAIVLGWLVSAGASYVTAEELKSSKKGTFVSAKESPSSFTSQPGASEDGQLYWAFRPLENQVSPSSVDPNWSRTPIDFFIHDKLQSAGLQPHSSANRRTLIRRAYLDLLGLPPTPGQVEAFVDSRDPAAYERLIDQLLSNPHYGERWGRFWLDLARFAESHGFEHDTDRSTAFHYRDFIIQALNQDMPYDTFVKWQIAGDEYEPENPWALTATGFLAAGVHSTQITANQAEKERYDELDDMVATIGTSMLGLTIGCARCHDHKFDPIPTEDYYRLLSTFTTTVRSEVDLEFNPEKYRLKKRNFDQDQARLAKDLERFEKDELPHRFDRWLRNNPTPPQPRWLTLNAAELKSKANASFKMLEDDSILVAGETPKFDTFTITTITPLKSITAVRLEALTDPSLEKSGPGRGANGGFTLSDFQLTASPLKNPNASFEISLKKPIATFELSDAPASAAIDDDRKSGWAVTSEFGKNHTIAFELETHLGFDSGTILTFTLGFDAVERQSIGRLRLSISTEELPLTLAGDQGSHDLALEVQKILIGPKNLRTKEQINTLKKWHRSIDTLWIALSTTVNQHLNHLPKPELTKVLICSEGLKPLRLATQGPDFYENTFLLRRGDPNQKERTVSQSFLRTLMRAPERASFWQVEPPEGWRTSYQRRALAKWITDADRGAGNLLARVIVNRLWQYHFGRGIVGTPSDFGSQGEKPTHPELLDWLAKELIRNNWHLKPLHKLMMTSAAYRQENKYNPVAAQLDPDNRLLWRFSPRRLESEAIRDSMLAVTGNLDERMFGPGTLDESHQRRSIYFTIKRSKLNLMMVLFDGPDALQSQGERTSTTVAPQALLIMNNPQVRAWARAFGRSIKPQQDESFTSAVLTGYHAALGRNPSEEELTDSLNFLRRQIGAYAKSEALELALGDFCQALLSLNEFVILN